MAQDGPEPCAGCKLSGRLNRGNYQAASYAVFLNAYLKAFRPSPRELSWLDFEIYQIYLSARAEHENEETAKYRKNMNQKRHS